MLIFLYQRRRLDILEMAKQDLSGVSEGTLSLSSKLLLNRQVAHPKEGLFSVL